MWGGASSAHQYEGGYDLGGRGYANTDYMTSGNRQNPRRMTLKLADGGRLDVKKSHGGLQIPEGACGAVYDDTYYPSHAAVDFYHRYKEDLRLLADMGTKCYRMSISWSRIFHNGDDGQPNEEGLRFYEDVFTECRRLGMEPMVTLCHFDMPAHLSQAYNGWMSHKTVDFFVRYQTHHHIFLASAKTVIEGHKINPDFKIGMMEANFYFYPESCNPVDSIRKNELSREW